MLGKLKSRLFTKLQSKNVANSIKPQINESRLFVISSNRQQRDNHTRIQDAERVTHPQPEQLTLGMIEDDQEQINLYPVPTYLKDHFNFMFYCGLSPVTGVGKKGSPLQIACFTVMTIISLLNTSGRLKLFVLEDARKGNLYDYVTSCFYISSGAIQIGFLCLAYRLKSMSGVIQRTIAKKPQIMYENKKEKISAWSIFIPSTGILISIMDAFRLDLLLKDNTLAEVILVQSHTTSLHFFLWAKDNNESSIYYRLNEEYGTHLGPATIILGLLGIIMAFIGTLQQIAIKDILLLSALHINRLSQIFRCNMMRISKQSGLNSQMLGLLRETHNQLTEMSSEIEDFFGKLFKFIHVDNLLFSSYYLLFFLKEDLAASAVYTFGCFVSILKISCMFYFSINALEKCQSVKISIRKKVSTEDDLNDLAHYKNATILLQNLEDCPIAIGSADFRIDETFALKFIGVIVPLFLFFQEEYNEQLVCNK